MNKEKNMMRLTNPIELYYNDYLNRKYKFQQKKLRGKSFQFYLNRISKHTHKWECDPTFASYSYIWNTFTTLILKRSPILLLSSEEVIQVMDTIDKGVEWVVFADKVLSQKCKMCEPLTSGACEVVRKLSFYDCIFYDYATHQKTRERVIDACEKHKATLFTVSFAP